MGRGVRFSARRLCVYPLCCTDVRSIFCLTILLCSIFVVFKQNIVRQGNRGGWRIAQFTWRQLLTGFAPASARASSRSSLAVHGI